MATKSEIEQIKDRLSIVDVVQSYLQLKKAGQNFKALCPFHSEKTPSFMVNPSLGIYKCFGCGESGDIYNFVQSIEHCDFGEALETLAKKAGVQLTKSKPDKGKSNRRDKLFALNSLVADVFHYFLTEHKVGEPAREYLKTRELTPETIKKFKLGFAPESWDTLVKFLPKKGYTLTTAAQLGLLIASDRGRGYYDRFRGRLMFPIFDTKDRVVGFSGRIISPEAKGAKYMNSPDSELFHKGQLLYGLNFAQSPARMSEEVILVEGNVDVLTLHQHGIENVVAPLGTALTTDQIRLLKRMCPRFFVAFDADSAGIKATVRSLELIENEGIEAKIVQLPKGFDPDKCVREDFRCWTRAKNSATQILDYQLQTIYRTHDLQNSLGKSQAAREAVALIDKLQSAVSKNYYIEKVAQALGTTTQALLTEMAKLGKTKKSTATSRAPAPSSQTKTDQTELALIKLVISEPSLIGRVKEIKAAWLGDEIVRSIFDKIVCQGEGDFKLDKFYDSLNDIEKKTISDIAFFEQPQDEESSEANLSRLAARLQIKYTERELNKIQLKIAEAEAKGEQESLMPLLQKQQDLRNQLNGHKKL